MSRLLRLPRTLLFSIVFAIGLALGWNVGRAPLLVKLSQQDAKYSKEKKEVAEAATLRLETANKRGDELSTKLLQSDALNEKLAKEKRYAIVKVTTGRTCFDESALRVLDGAPGLSVSELPKTASSAAAAGGRVATDTDIGGWAVDAGKQYKTCKSRLDGLIDFFLPTTKATTP